jgi:hypothetical protein
MELSTRNPICVSTAAARSAAAGSSMAVSSARITGGDTTAMASEAFKIKGREFIIDSDYTMAVAWKLYFGDLMTDLVFGPLRWTPDS